MIQVLFTTTHDIDGRTIDADEFTTENIELGGLNQESQWLTLFKDGKKVAAFNRNFVVSAVILEPEPVLAGV